MDATDDGRMYRTARQILDGDFLWLEEGIVGLQENLSLPDFADAGPATAAPRESSSAPEGVGA
jgi:hypothetical protein